MKKIRSVAWGSAVLVVASLFASTQSYTSDLSHSHRKGAQTPLFAGATLSPSWPGVFAVQHTGAINASFNDLGVIGNGFGGPPAPVSFEVPPASGVDYLFAGAIWVGGIVGQDTMVSVGFDGWQDAGEMAPTDMAGTVRPFATVADTAYQAEFADTGKAFDFDPVNYLPHRPLGIKIINRSQIFTSTPANNCVFYDLAVSNIGHNAIRQGYVGIFVDGDVGDASDFNRGTDDLAGSFKSQGVGYIIDNDGNPSSGFKATKLMACKILSTSFQSPKTSFNWWVSNGNAPLDFGPQSKAKFRDLGTGGQGTPEGDRNKYAFLQNGEWDYDQVFISTITTADLTWTLPPLGVYNTYIQRGGDVKFLLSVGPFDLDPDSTVRVQYVMFTADSVHRDPANFGTNLVNDSNPDNFYLGLNFEGVRRNSFVADSLAPLVVSQLNPPSGLQVVTADRSAVYIRWDTLFNGNVDGYNIYATEIPDSVVENSSVLPVWAEHWVPIVPELYGAVGNVGHATITLSSCKWYAIQVASRQGTAIGPLGRVPVYGHLAIDLIPTTKDTLLYYRDGLVPSVEWLHQSGSQQRCGFIDS